MTDADRSDRWWLPIAALAATLPVLAVFALVLPPDPAAMLPAFAVALLGFALSLSSPVFRYFDRRFLAAASAWTPSVWYYLMAVTAVAPLVAAAYVYRRNQRVGVPANPFAARRG
ncbi:hypothetical protein [Halobacterium sp. R2-5]|uniref:hypothetical protein n=1 Tax=Halobacterium sp. R2-5 TaxID=2715751 RepID=UPI0014243CAE|nr:hypothetical protein [Halobacterium sp. R2-5]NIB99912.1 hypothetical protein [Halobacterium sp. R2-5]